MPYEIAIEDPRIGFASAHFIVEHDKCGKMHGHNYFLRVVIQGELDDKHMVVDYGVLKQQLRKLTKKLDHKVLVPIKARGLTIEQSEKTITITAGKKRWIIPKDDIILLPIPASTAEELAKYFHHKISSLWPDFTIKVTIEEAPGSTASYFE
jgi:6-pyruvoyltetrahydropterin/6-carboxytetrahydropterin synthase